MTVQELTTNTKIWKPIPSYPQYEVSEYGDIRRNLPGRGTKKGYILKACINRGYKQVNLFNKSIKNYRLVSEAFIGPKPLGYHCHHKDNNKLNDHYTNIEYLPAQKHNAMKIDKIGEKCNWAKLTEQGVFKIYSLYNDGYRITEIAEYFHVSHSTINNIIIGRNWKHLYRQLKAPIKLRSRKGQPRLKNINRLKAAIEKAKP